MVSVLILIQVIMFLHDQSLFCNWIVPFFKYPFRLYYPVMTPSRFSKHILQYLLDIRINSIIFKIILCQQRVLYLYAPATQKLVTVKLWYQFYRVIFSFFFSTFKHNFPFFLHFYINIKYSFLVTIL